MLYPRNGLQSYSTMQKVSHHMFGLDENSSCTEKWSSCKDIRYKVTAYSAGKTTAIDV